MFSDISTTYRNRSDDELLQLASDRAALSEEASAALDGELSRRHLTKSDQLKHERFVKHCEQREARRRRRKIFGNRRDEESWVDNVVVGFSSVVVMALIAIAYLALPSRYHFAPQWQEAAVIVMFPTVFLAVGSSFRWRKIRFWASLLISSTLHLLVIHAWIQRSGALDGPGHRVYGKLAVVLGIVLFILVYGSTSFIRRKFYVEDAADTR